MGVNDREILRVLGRNIRQARLKAGLTQECLSELSGVHVQTIGALEHGNFPFAVTTFARISQFLEISPNRLLDGLRSAGPGTDGPHQKGSRPQTRSPENRVGRCQWHFTRLRSEVGTREVERRRRVGELGALGAIAQRRGPSLGRKPARLPHNSIASVTSARFARRIGRGREGDRADRKPVEPRKSRVGHCAARRVEHNCALP